MSTNNLRIFPERKRRSNLSESILARQERVRELYRETLARPPESSTVGEVCIAMLPNGELRLVAINIEPEQVPAYLQALDDMKSRLLEHQAQHASVKSALISLNSGRFAKYRRAT